MMNETEKEALRQDIRNLRAEGFPLSQSQMEYLTKVATGHAVKAWISRHGAPRDENGERIVEKSWIEISWKNARWTNGGQPTKKRIVRYRHGDDRAAELQRVPIGDRLP